jgi:hypothetical protein
VRGVTDCDASDESDVRGMTVTVVNPPRDEGVAVTVVVRIPPPPPLLLSEVSDEVLVFSLVVELLDVLVLEAVVLFELVEVLDGETVVVIIEVTVPVSPD